MMSNGDSIQYDVFISYAWADGIDFARQLEQEIKNIGLRVWRDPNIRKSADFTAEIEIAIRSSKLVIVVMTDYIEHNEKSFVRREVSYAEMKGKPILVARFHRAMIIQLANHTYVDFVDNRWETAFPFLSQAIHKEIGLMERREYQSPELPKPLQDDPYRAYVKETYELAVDILEQTTILHREIDLIARTELERIGRTSLRSSLRQAYQRIGVKRDNLPDLTSVGDALDEFDGRLLLLGEPGSGKTTALLALTRDLAAIRLGNPGAVLPIFAFCSTWNASPPQAFHEWLAEQTAISAHEIKEMMDSGSAILVLDGLDELVESQTEEDEQGQFITYDPRRRFIQVIPSIGKLLISSRIEEYEEIGDRLEILNGAITLQNLTNEQIKSYLSELPALWDVLQVDPILLDVARTPLLLSLFAYGFRDAPESAQKLRDLQGADLRNAVFTNYINQRYEHESHRLDAMGEYPPFMLEQIYDVLGRVAMINASSGGMRTYKNDFSIIRDNILSRLDFEEALYSEDLAGEFIEFMLNLHLIASLDGELRFIHLRLRDTLVSLYCTRERLFDKSYYRYSFEPNPARAVGSLPRGECLPLLTELLESDSPAMLRSSAARGLGKTHLQEARDILIDILLHDADFRVRSTSAAALGSIGDELSQQTLIHILATETLIGLRINALAGLAEIATPEARDIIIAILQNKAEDLEVRAAAAINLRDIGDARSREVVIHAFDPNEDGWLLGEIAGALWKFGDEEIMHILIKALQSESYQKAALAIAIGLNAMNREEGLIAILQFPDELIDLDGKELHQRVADKLENIATANALAAIQQWRSSQSE